MTEPGTPTTAQSDDRAAQAYQAWLDLSSERMLAGDSGGFSAMVSLPFVMRTITTENVFETREDLVSDMSIFVDSLRTQGVTNYIRLVKSARFLNDRIIEGWHTSYMLRNAVNVVAPYKSHMILRQVDDDTWQVIEAEHELASQHFPVNLTRSIPGGFAEKWAKPLADIRTTHVHAAPIYQVFIDTLSEAVHQRDFKAWCDLFTTPHEVHFDSTDHIVNNPDDDRPFFELLCREMQEKGADRLVRHASQAEFIGPDRIFGYHDTYMTKDDTPCFGPVKSRMILTLDEAQWKCTSVTNSLSNKDLTGPEFQPSDLLPTMREIHERMKK